MKKIKWWLPIFFGLGMIADIFIYSSKRDIIILILTGLWVLNIKLNKIKSNVSIWISLILFTLCPFLSIFEKALLAEKAGIWAFLFLTMGVFQKMIAKRKTT